MLNKIYKAGFILGFITLPLLVKAQEPLGGTYRFFFQANNIVSNYLVPIAFTLALLVFFWGIVKYIWGEGHGKDDGRKIMIWGVIALFVMSSIWGIIYFLRREVGIGDQPYMPIPTIGGDSSSGPTGKAGDGYTDPIK